MPESTAARVGWIALVLMVALGGAAEAVRAEEITLDESSAVRGSQKGEGRLEYQNFIKIAVSDFTELDTLFYSDASSLDNPGQIWSDICAQAVTHIREGLKMAVKHAPGKDPGTEARAWFDGLAAMWAKLQIHGKKAYLAKVKLDIELAHRKKSIKQNASYKQDYWEALQELDGAYGDALALTKASDAKERSKLRRKLDKEHAPKGFADFFDGEKNWAANHTTAAMKGVAAVNANKKAGDPKTLAKDLDGLKECVVDGEEGPYGSFVRARNFWDAAIDNLYEEYEKKYNEWLKELDWILESKLFKDTANLRDCTWNELGPRFKTMYSAITE